MKSCNEFGCIDKMLPIKRLAERGTVTATHYTAQPEMIIVTVTCIHGGTRGHAIYPKSPEWGWAISLCGSTSRLAA
jgi:hypothetical protein